MVCVPCIILPVLLAIYLKFIQPFLLRFVPERWSTALDSILYPTCPIQQQNVSKEQAAQEQKEEENANGESKKEN